MSRFAIVTLSMFMVYFGGALILWWASAPILSMTWLGVLLFALPNLLIMLGDHRASHALTWMIPHTQCVRTMHHDGEIRYVLAYGEPGQVLHAHIYWLNQQAPLQLHPNGYVTGTSYVYFWEPVDLLALSHMHLTYDCEDLDKLKHMSWHAREEYRFTLKKQTKLDHQTHI